MSDKKEFEFKDTLNLPKTTLAMRANAPVREIEIQDFWEMHKIYEKNLAQRNIDNKFVLHDGPPYLSSPKIHIGTALNKILKDILTKYKAQSGYYSPYVPGYDGHGLPIENAVVKTIEAEEMPLQKVNSEQNAEILLCKTSKVRKKTSAVWVFGATGNILM